MKYRAWQLPGVVPIRNAVITLFVRYPHLPGWIDLWYRLVMTGKPVAIPRSFLITSILSRVPFLCIVGFIVGPELITSLLPCIKYFQDGREFKQSAPILGIFVNKKVAGKKQNAGMEWFYGF